MLEGDVERTLWTTESESRTDMRARARDYLDRQGRGSCVFMSQVK